MTAKNNTFTLEQIYNIAIQCGNVYDFKNFVCSEVFDRLYTGTDANINNDLQIIISVIEDEK